MPQINVSERTVSPRLDRGLVTGLIAGGVVSAWMLLIGALGGGASSDHGVAKSALALGDEVLSRASAADWLVGLLVHLAAFALIGVLFALVWPRIRRYGTWTPALLFWLVIYVVDIQVLVRLLSPEVANRLSGVGMIIGYLLAGLVFAYRYRRA